MLLFMLMDKLLGMLDTHVRGTEKWKSVVGPKTEENLMSNIMRSSPITVMPIWVGRLRHDVYEYIDPCFNVSTQHLIYSSQFQPLPMHNMPKVCEDGTLQDDGCNVFPGFQPPILFTMSINGQNGSGCNSHPISVTFTSSEHLFGTIRVCKEKLLNLPIGEEFCRAFIYYACASMTIVTCGIPSMRMDSEMTRSRDLQPQRLLWSQRLMWTMRQMLSLKIVIMSNRPISRGIQQQLGIMRDLMQKLGARRHSRVNTEATGYSGYAPTDNPTADDHVFPDCEEQPEGDVMRLSDFIITPTNRNVWRRRVRRMAPSLLFPFISQPQTRQYAIRMDLKEAIALVFGGDLDASEKLVAMHDTSLTRVNLGYFEGDGWIGNNVVDVYCRLLQYEHEPKTKLFLSPT
ncbi:hypothetical protein CK203_114559 [Vitis vinifera]|uniref:Uncharacterized protein n=1 Tax=Vitis vinifera TaxID=29760 RepID=A0A438C8U6_VITVI|nr:hypothetical protein CK203_114559 [Vitis vinifera]